MKSILAILSVLCALGCGSRGSGEAVIPSNLIVISDRKIIESDGSYNGFPGLVQAANGDWVLGYKKGPNHVSSNLVVLRRSQDQGQTWSPEVQYFDSSTPDPGLFLLPDNRLMIQMGKTDQNSIAGAAYSYSSDNGITWGTFGFYGSPPNEVSETLLAPIPGSSLYSVGYGPHGDGSFDAKLYQSIDNGASWPAFSTIRQSGEGGINETSIAYLGGSDIFAMSRSDSGTTTIGHFSRDLGKTWEPQIDYSTQVGILQYPILLQTTNALLLFARHITQSAPWEFSVFASYDGAKTFTDQTLLDTYTGLAIDGGYCAVLVRPDGKILVVYYADSNNLRLPDIKSLVLQWNKNEVHSVSTTTNYGFQKFFSSWTELHPGSGPEDLANSLLDNVDSVLAAAPSNSLDAITVRSTDTSAPITQKTGTVILSKGSAGAWTLAAPAAGLDDGKILAIVGTTAFAHTVITPSGKLNGAHTTVTYAAVGDAVVLEAYNGIWYTRSLTGAAVS